VQRLFLNQAARLSGAAPARIGCDRLIFSAAAQGSLPAAAARAARGQRVAGGSLARRRCGLGC